MTKLKKNTSASPKDSEQNKRLLELSRLDADQALAAGASSLDGLGDSAVEKSRQSFGENKLHKIKKASLPKRLLTAFVNPFTVVLFILSIISLITDVIIAPVGQKDPSSVIIIIVMVIISGVLRFAQEARSGRAAEKLSEMIKTTVAVKRGGKDAAELPISELVAGDIVLLGAGDMVPADMRVIKAKDLFISQSALTGESEPVEKHSEKYAGNEYDPIELGNLVFMGTNVVSGSATSMVVNVGDATLFGTIAKELSDKKPVTSFEKGINSISWVLIRFMMIMVPVVFLLSGFRSRNWTDSFLFALSVAVGLTPAMLPTIVSANLAKGAVALSRKKVVVKDLNSIQNFGAMNILCTDKTGTLTQDKVALMYSLDINGNEDESVVEMAYLNSYYQTGLHNLMDIAVLDYAAAHKEDGEEKIYKKLDEIPFDFTRRRMSVVVEDSAEKKLMITKGAAEEILQICSHVLDKGEARLMDDETHNKVKSTVENYNTEGLRVIAIAVKDNPSPVEAFSVADENNMVLIGYLAFLDPPKDSTTEAIKALNEYGVGVKILTGDNDAVTRAVCKKVGIPADTIMLGSEVEAMDDKSLDEKVMSVSVFAKMSPSQKSRVVQSLRRLGNTVGYMGDGINDAASLKQADVGISVDTAVDIAKESANLILLEKDLMVLKEGIIEGRKTYANIIKYIKMTVSSNFGNMFSVLAASLFLPFLPMLPLQLLILNLIYDISCIGIPWDNVDAEFLKIPRKWDASSLSKFMLWLGPTSSVFDITTYLALFFIICPAVIGGSYHALSPDKQAAFVSLFHTGWFVESLWTQTLVIHMIRTAKIPFVQSRASKQMLLFTSGGILAGTLLTFLPFAGKFGFATLPAKYFILLIATVAAYVFLTTIVKKLYIKKYKELL